MNLVSGFETSPYAFYVCLGIGATAMCSVVGIGGIRLIRDRRSQLFLGPSSFHTPQSRLSRVWSGRRDGA